MGGSGHHPDRWGGVSMCLKNPCCEGPTGYWGWGVLSHFAAVETEAQRYREEPEAQCPRRECCCQASDHRGLSVPSCGDFCPPPPPLANP